MVKDSHPYFKTRMKTIDLLKQSTYRIFNVEVARILGINSTLVLMELADAENYDGWKEQLAITDDWFYLTYEQLTERTTLSEYSIREAIKNLKSLGILDTKMKGQPAKQHYKINHEILESTLLTSRPTVFDTSRPIENCTSRPIENYRAIYKKESNKKENNRNSPTAKFQSDFISLFSLYYKQQFNQTFSWDGKQAKAISYLIQKILVDFKTANNLNPSIEEMLDVFNIILSRALKDNWLFKNYEPAIINSKYNILKSSKYEKTAKQSEAEQFANDIISGRTNWKDISSTP